MKLLASIVCALPLAACSDGNDASGIDTSTAAREITVHIENVAPWTVLKAGVQRLRTSGVEGIAGPGEAFELTFTAGTGQKLTFAAPLHESNDWFFAPSPGGIPLYDNGVPIAGDITSQIFLWDAGTEADEEPGVGGSTCGNQTSRDAGAPDPDRRVRVVPESMTLTSGSAYARPAVSSMIRVTITPGSDRKFTLRLENVSTTTTLQTSSGATKAIHVAPFVWAIHRSSDVMFADGAAPRDNGLEALAETGQPDALSTALRVQRGISSALSPGVFVVHRDHAPLYALGFENRGMGLEELAEDGDATVLTANLGRLDDVSIRESGTFDTPLDAHDPSPAGPGQSFVLEVNAEPGDRLSFATMMTASNDWFFATPPEGIPLFDGEVPRSGDLSGDIALYDLGTELDEELDVGPSTAVQQSAPNTGRPDATTEIRAVTVDRYDAPVTRHIMVTVAPSDIID
jgi:hypothetical protein